MTSFAFLKNLQRPVTAFGVLFCLAITSLTASPAVANDEPADRGYRWFEIEVLVFRYLHEAGEDDEQFPLSVRPIATEGSRDILTPRLRADVRGFIQALPQCEGTRGWVPVVRQLLLKPSDLRAEIADYSATNISCRRLPHLPIVDAWYLGQSEVHDRLPNHAPLVVAGHADGSRKEMLRADIPFLIQQDDFEYNALRRQLERRGDTQPILHTSWRQPVFTRNVGRKMRLFGGRNFTDEFDYFGFPISPTPKQQALSFRDEARTVRGIDEDAFSRIEVALAAIEQGQFAFTPWTAERSQQPSRPTRTPRGLPSEVWELDGLLHVYLVGNFLHIDVDFNLRDVIQLEAAARHYDEQVDDYLNADAHQLEFLRAYPFQQLRRVISHQTHYFDHPKYGMVITIRRTDLSARR